MTCPKCGKELKTGVRFCTGCGSPLPEMPAASAEKEKIPVAMMMADARSPLAAKASKSPLQPVEFTQDHWGTSSTERTVYIPPPPLQHTSAPPIPHRAPKRATPSKPLLHAPQVQRGGCFTVLLLLITVGSFLWSATLLARGQAIMSYLQSLVPGLSLPAWILPFSIGTAVACLLGAFGMWMWRRWGVLLYFASYLAGMGANLYLTHRPGELLIGGIVLGVVYLIVRPYWDAME